MFVALIFHNNHRYWIKNIVKFHYSDYQMIFICGYGKNRNIHRFKCKDSILLACYCEQEFQYYRGGKK